MNTKQNTYLSNVCCSPNEKSFYYQLLVSFSLFLILESESNGTQEYISLKSDVVQMTSNELNKTCPSVL